MDGTYLEIALSEKYREKYYEEIKTQNLSEDDTNQYMEYFEKNIEYQAELAEIKNAGKENKLSVTKHWVDMIVKWEVEELPCLWFPDYIIEPQRQYKDKPAVTVLKGNMHTKTTNPEENHKLYLEIDLTKRENTILEEIKKVLRKNQAKILVEPKKPKSFSYDKWLIYDMHKRGGMNFCEIARKLSGKKGNPSYNKELAKHWSKVKMAYKNAEKAINQMKETTQ